MSDDRGGVAAIAAALADFVADPAPWELGFDPPLDLRAVAAATGLLPALLDMGGCLGILPSGAVGALDWDEPGRVRDVDDARLRAIAYHRAALRHPALGALAPRRGEDAAPCPACGGSGRCPGLPAGLADRILCECGGLGWVPGPGPRRIARPVGGA